MPPTRLHQSRIVDEAGNALHCYEDPSRLGPRNASNGGRGHASTIRRALRGAETHSNITNMDKENIPDGKQVWGFQVWTKKGIYEKNIVANYATS